MMDTPPLPQMPNAPASPPAFGQQQAPKKPQGKPKAQPSFMGTAGAGEIANNAGTKTFLGQ